LIPPGEGEVEGDGMVKLMREERGEEVGREKRREREAVPPAREVKVFMFT